MAVFLSSVHSQVKKIASSRGQKCFVFSKQRDFKIKTKTLDFVPNVVLFDKCRQIFKPDILREFSETFLEYRCT